MSSKVFISSVIRGMERERASARFAVESLEFVPLQAEDFPASPATPQAACLAGVREADVLVLLIGERYGGEQPSGVSATEEEVNEARRLGRPILAFRTSEGRDEEQGRFLTRVSGWLDGTTIKACLSPEELQKEVVRALRHMSMAPPATEVSDTVAANLSRVLPEVQRGVVSQIGPWIAFSWVPTHPPVGLDEREFFTDVPELVGDLLVSGRDRLLEARPEVRPSPDGVEISSPGQYAGARQLLGWVGMAGDLAMGVSFRAPRSRDTSQSFVESMHARPSLAQERLASVLGVCSCVLDRLDPGRAVQTGLGQAGVGHLGMARFAEPAAEAQSGFPVNVSSDQAVVVPRRPETISRFDLRADSPVVERFIERFQRSMRQSEP